MEMLFRVVTALIVIGAVIFVFVLWERWEERQTRRSKAREFSNEKYIQFVDLLVKTGGHPENDLSKWRELIRECREADEESTKAYAPGTAPRLMIPIIQGAIGKTGPAWTK